MKEWWKLSLAKQWSCKETIHCVLVVHGTHRALIGTHKALIHDDYNSLFLLDSKQNPVLLNPTDESARFSCVVIDKWN